MGFTTRAIRFFDGRLVDGLAPVVPPGAQFFDATRDDETGEITLAPITQCEYEASRIANFAKEQLGLQFNAEQMSLLRRICDATPPF